MKSNCHQVQQPWRFVAALLLTAGLVSDAFGSTTTGDLQAMQIRDLKNATEMFKDIAGAYPVTDDSGTWFEKLVENEYWYFDTSWSRRFNLTQDEALPMGAFDHPIIYEIVNGVAVFRAVGRNGIDDGGKLDDFDSRYGANVGYWNKAGWPAVYRRGGQCAVVILGFLIMLIPIMRRWRWARFLGLLVPGFIAVVILPYGFDAGFVRSSASRLPGWLNTAPHIGVFVVIVGVCVLMVDSGRMIAARFHRHQEHQCPKCGYDLRGDLDAGCPECGWNREPGETTAEATS